MPSYFQICVMFNSNLQAVEDVQQQLSILGPQTPVRATTEVDEAQWVSTLLERPGARATYVVDEDQWVEDPWYGMPKGVYIYLFFPGKVSPISMYSVHLFLLQVI